METCWIGVKMKEIYKDRHFTVVQRQGFYFVVKTDAPNSLLFKAPNVDECIRYMLRFYTSNMMNGKSTKVRVECANRVLDLLPEKHKNRYRKQCIINDIDTTTNFLEHVTITYGKGGNVSGYHLSWTGYKTMFNIFIKEDGTVSSRRPNSFIPANSLLINFEPM